MNEYEMRPDPTASLSIGHGRTRPIQGLHRTPARSLGWSAGLCPAPAGWFLMCRRKTSWFALGLVAWMGLANAAAQASTSNLIVDGWHFRYRSRTHS